MFHGICRWSMWTLRSTKQSILGIPTFIISVFMCHGMSRQYEIESHTLDLDNLRCLKLAKICYYKDDMISKLLSRFQSVNFCGNTEKTQSLILKGNTQKEIYGFTKLRQQFKKDEDEFFLKTQLLESERLSFNREKQNLCRERQAFEKEKHNLETDLAKYKGIVENCKKEIESFGF